jgi:hypothetical protein
MQSADIKLHIEPVGGLMEVHILYTKQGRIEKERN